MLPVFEAGGYRYIKAVFQYSGGVAAQPGYEIERARFAKPLPLADAYAAVEAHLKALGPPDDRVRGVRAALARAVHRQGFIDFNRSTCRRSSAGASTKAAIAPVNPVARTNVCPMYDKPAEPVMYAFSYTVPAQAGRTRGSFIVSGSGDARAGGETYSDAHHCATRTPRPRACARK